MPDRFEDTLRRLGTLPPPNPFAPPSAIRRRGRQRARRHLIAAAATALAVTGTAASTAIWADGGPAPVSTVTPPATTPATPPVTASATPPAGVDLTALLLRPDDLGPGGWRTSPATEPFHGDTWYWSDLCPAYRSTDYPSLGHQTAVEHTGYVADPRYVYEHVHRYAAGWGARALDDVRRVVAACAGGAPRSAPAGGEAPSRYTVVARDFAGEEALLVREERWYYAGERLAPEPLTRLISVVRVGDLVATVAFSPDGGEAHARGVTVAAAARLTPR